MGNGVLPFLGGPAAQAPVRDTTREVFSAAETASLPLAQTMRVLDRRLVDLAIAAAETRRDLLALSDDPGNDLSALTEWGGPFYLAGSRQRKTVNDFVWGMANDFEKVDLLLDDAVPVIAQRLADLCDEAERVREAAGRLARRYGRKVGLGAAGQAGPAGR